MGVGEAAVRRCAGVWRAGRRTPCPYAAQLPPRARRDQCERCSALDRTSSVAADTRADDPQPYAVYLAYFGPGLHKVGITAVARGRLRLLEQAAVCFTFLGEGPLMAARRTEAVLGAALRIPDRVRDPAKRAARRRLPRPGGARGRSGGAVRPGDGASGAAAAVADAAPAAPAWTTPRSSAWPRRPVPPNPARGEPAAEVTALPPGCALTGTVRAVAGHDLHLDTPDGPLLLDTRLAAGWPLLRPPDDASSGVPTAPLRLPAQEPQPLF